MLWTLTLRRLPAGSFSAEASFRVLPFMAGATASTRSARFAAALRHFDQHLLEFVIDALVIAHVAQLAAALAGAAAARIDTPRSLLVLTIAVGCAAAAVSLAVLVDTDGAQAAAARYSGATPQRTLLSAYHDVLSPARMLMPAKQGVVPLGIAERARAPLQAQIAPQTAPPRQRRLACRCARI